MRVPIFQVDAFTDRLFSGNPAAVCLLPDWPEDGILQAVAAENNLSETAFLVRRPEGYELRWMTPAVEVDLCGHATLASAFVIMEHLEPGVREVCFQTRSGRLRVWRQDELLVMDFPARPPEPCAVPAELEPALGAAPRQVLSARDLMAVFEDEEQVRNLRPDMERLKSLEYFAVIATAPGRRSDFVSRFFAPRQGVPEDPVTGSAHATLVPYWSRRLGKARLDALQVSRRGGKLWCEDRGERVWIAGRAVLYMEGTIYLPD